MPRFIIRATEIWKPYLAGFHVRPDDGINLCGQAMSPTRDDPDVLTLAFSPPRDPCPGGDHCYSADLNGNCAVGLDDLALLLAAFGSPAAGVAPFNGDTNLDGIVDLADLELLLTRFAADCRE